MPQLHQNCGIREGLEALNSEDREVRPDRAFPMKAVKHIPDSVYPQEVRQKAVDLFAQGAGYKRVSTAIGVPLYTVRDWARQYKAGKFHAEIPDNIVCYDKDTREWAMALRRSGMSWSKFEKTTGISRATCLKWLLEEENALAQHTENSPVAESIDKLKMSKEEEYERS